jgi:ubiquinone/menaquinone biosynthesis C-methylase UbiE
MNLACASQSPNNMRKENMFFLNNRIGLLLYHILPNYIIWKLLSAEEKKVVLKNNIIKNNLAYNDTESYNINHELIGDPLGSKFGKFLASWVDKKKPTNILEIGPGGGYYTPVLFRSNNTANYDAVDCVKGFLNIIEKLISDSFKNVRFKSYHGDFLPISKKLESAKYDLILTGGFLHHVPNREEFAVTFERLLKPGGIVIAYEQTHYIRRIITLLRRYLRFLWQGSSWYISYGSGTPCTHHGLTLKELKNISSKSTLKLEYVTWNYKWSKNSLLRYLSTTAYFVLKKQSTD